MQKYPRGRRGSPAKGVGVYKAREGSNPSFCARKHGHSFDHVFAYNLYLRKLNRESYRSGHNGAVLKTVRGQPHRGSNPLLSAK